MKTRFIIYGLMGWILEIIWTGLESLYEGDPRLTAQTYLWMFPIYGLAVFLEPLHDAIRKLPWYVRGLVWVPVIFAIEYSTGGIIRKIAGSSPWNYSGTSSWEIHGLIRLDMAPLWFITGLIFEQAHDFLTRYKKLEDY
ncbi:MAG: hypothetical protein H0Z40_04750 [Desulfotomaculum sp.]|nr:hypothetical protein [Desulfotomaculum sp.]